MVRPAMTIYHFLERHSKFKNRKDTHKKLDTSLHDESHWTKKIAAFNFLFTGQELKLGLSKRTSKNK